MKNWYNQGMDHTSTLETVFNKQVNDRMLVLLDMFATAKGKLTPPPVVDNTPEGKMYSVIAGDTGAYTVQTTKATAKDIVVDQHLESGSGLLSFIGKKASNKIVGYAKVDDYRVNNYKALTESTLDTIAANKLISQAKAGQTLFGESTKAKEQVAPEYKLDILQIQQALEKKYRNLGSLQRGTKKGERVLYDVNTSQLLENELKYYEGNISTIAKTYNDSLTQALRSGGVLGTNQTATMTNEQLQQTLLYNIHTEHTMVNSTESGNYVGDQFILNDSSNDSMEQAPTL